MKKKILSIFIMIGLVASLAACGNNGKETETASTEVVQKDALEEAAEEPVASGNRESEEKSKEETVSDVKGEVEYTEQRDIFVVKQIDTGDGSEIDLSKQETISGPFVFTESIDIYSYFFTYAGYTKPDIEVHSVGKIGDWIFVPFAQSAFLVKTEDFDRVAVLKDKGGKNEEIPEVAEISEVISEKSTADEPEENSPEMPTTEASAPEQSNKYTPEEAIAVYRSAMEAGGMTWDPSIKDVTSWGTGWIYLEKGQPEWCASTNLESAAMGDSAGRSWTKYYLEVTGSDENAVYVTEWTSN